jgi:hypothetical protein
VDTHTTVEVAIGGRWVVYDPTFNVSFTRNGRYLGVSELYDAWVLGHGDPVKTVFYGEVLYPARIDNFHVSYRSVLNNYFVEPDTPRQDFLSKIPISRYYFGPFLEWYGPDNRVSVYEKINKLIWSAFVLLPTISILLFIVIIIKLSCHLFRKESRV